MNRKSKLALCATKTAPFENSRNEGSTCSMGGSRATRWSLIPVSWVMNGEMATPGFTNAWKVASRSPAR